MGLITFKYAEVMWGLNNTRTSEKRGSGAGGKLNITPRRFFFFLINDVKEKIDVNVDILQNNHRVLELHRFLLFFKPFLKKVLGVCRSYRRFNGQNKRVTDDE